jgi:hypothetical protein
METHATLPPVPDILAAAAALEPQIRQAADAIEAERRLPPHWRAR